jgi:hypothetical protein
MSQTGNTRPYHVMPCLPHSHMYHVASLNPPALTSGPRAVSLGVSCHLDTHAGTSLSRISGMNNVGNVQPGWIGEEGFWASEEAR